MCVVSDASRTAARGWMEIVYRKLKRCSASNLRGLKRASSLHRRASILVFCRCCALCFVPAFSRLVLSSLAMPVLCFVFCVVLPIFYGGIISPSSTLWTLASHDMSRFGVCFIYFFCVFILRQMLKEYGNSYERAQAGYS